MDCSDDRCEQVAAVHRSVGWKRLTVTGVNRWSNLNENAFAWAFFSGFDGRFFFPYGNDSKPVRSAWF